MGRLDADICDLFVEWLFQLVWLLGEEAMVCWWWPWQGGEGVVLGHKVSHQGSVLGHKVPLVHVGMILLSSHHFTIDLS